LADHGRGGFSGQDDLGVRGFEPQRVLEDLNHRDFVAYVDHLAPSLVLAFASDANPLAELRAPRRMDEQQRPRG
jgi:hypothetical protein